MPSERRLHPSAFLVHALAGLREVLVPAVVAFVVGARHGPGGATLIAAIAVVASAVLGWARWARTRYWTEDDALHFRTGLLTPEQRTVPIARIAAVDEVQGPIQRLFGVVAVHVQTAGGGRRADIVLTAVSRADAEALRVALGRAPAAADDEADVAVPSWALGRRGLAVAAVTGPQV